MPNMDVNLKDDKPTVTEAEASTSTDHLRIKSLATPASSNNNLKNRKRQLR